MNNQAHPQKIKQPSAHVEPTSQKYNAKSVTLMDAFEKSIDIIMGKYEDSWKDWIKKYDELDVQQKTAKKQERKVSAKNQEQNKKQPISKLKTKAEVKIIKHQSSAENPVKQLHVEVNIEPKQAKQMFRTRTKSQNTHLKSIKKTNELLNVKEEEEKKGLRLKQITKRKIQLMDKLKKIDAELLEAKREASPMLDKTANIEKSFVQSNLNKSYLSNLNNSRTNKQNESVVEHHMKAVEMLQKINNEKIRRQERVAEQLRRKQQIQMLKLRQLEMKKSIEIEDRRRRNQAGSKLSKAKKQLINQSKLNDFVDSEQNALIPTTLVKKDSAHQPKEDIHEGFFDKIHKNSKNNLLTQRDMQLDYESHSKLFDQQVLKKEEKNLQNQPQKTINYNVNETKPKSQKDLAFPTQPISETNIPPTIQQQ